MKKPSKHVCSEAQDLACIQLGEGNATSFNHKMLYFTSSALACFPVSSGRSGQWDILEQSAVAHTQASASSTASPVPSPRLAGPLQPGAPGGCLLPSLLSGPLQPAVHSRARLQGWPAASGARLSCSVWGFGWGAADPFTSTGYQLFVAVSSEHSNPKLQGSLSGRRKISQQLLVRGMVTQQDHDWSPLAFPGC